MGTNLDKNDNFYLKTESAFRNLFESAREKHELHFALALMPEMRGMQDPGWNTARETQRVFHAYIRYLEEMSPGDMKLRTMLSFYSHLSEASGFYEIPKNMLRIAEGKSHMLWPFSELVKQHKVTGTSIAPNANKVLGSLAAHAKKLGFIELSEVFRDSFDSDIRNGYAHANYVVWNDGLRLPNRNGGSPRIISWDRFQTIFERGVNFYFLLEQVLNEYVHAYRTPRKIRAKLQDEPEADWIISFDITTKKFGISTA